MDDKQYEILDKETVYQGFFRLETYSVKHTLFKGGWNEGVKRELFRRGDCVAVLLYDPVLDEVVLVEQFRIGAVLQNRPPWLIEIVAGAVEQGEIAEDAAMREALEEADCHIHELRLINRFFTSPGGASEWLSLYYGRVDASNVGGIHGLDEEGEDIRVFSVKFDEAWEMLQSGVIDSAIPIVAMQWLYINRDTIRSIE